MKDGNRREKNSLAVECTPCPQQHEKGRKRVMKGIVAVSLMTVFAAGSAAGSVSLQVENTFVPSGKAMGLDVRVVPTRGETILLGSNNTDDAVYTYSTSGTVLNTIYLDPANGSCFGVVLDPATEAIHTSDWSEANLFTTSDWGNTWSTVSDPSGVDGRGLAFNGTDYWMTNGYAGLLVFQPGSAPSAAIPLPQIYSQLSGLTVFPLEGQTCIAVTTYTVQNIWFYLWDGTELTFIGWAPCPVTCQASYGLAYSQQTDTIFWSYMTGTDAWFVSELSYELETGFEPDSWAGIKRSF